METERSGTLRGENFVVAGSHGKSRENTTRSASNRALYMHAQEVDLGEFSAVCEQRAEAADYPRAMGVEKNILIYSGDRLRDEMEQARDAVLSELHRALSAGPGVLAIKGAYPDPAVVDRHSAVFERIFADETASGVAADHFAKAGANARIWNSLQKAARHDPDSFIDYYGNPLLALVSEAWLGPWYQMTAQVNVVKPGGEAQQPHRDYHLGFQTEESVARFPLPVQILSQYLTLQGAVAHTDMPIESGPTQLLPFSHQSDAGYLAWRRNDFIDYFKAHAVQLSLTKGDAVFFSPALFHAAGSNTTTNHIRIANLLQISSAFAKPMETVNRVKMLQDLYPALGLRCRHRQLGEAQLSAVIAAAADGYSFPTNLDSDPPVGGMAPQTQQQLLRQALDEGWDATDFNEKLLQNQAKREA